MGSGLSMRLRPRKRMKMPFEETTLDKLDRKFHKMFCEEFDREEESIEQK